MNSVQCQLSDADAECSDVQCLMETGETKHDLMLPTFGQDR